MKKLAICIGLFLIAGCAHISPEQKYTYDKGTLAIAQYIADDTMAYSEYCTGEVDPENVAPCQQVVAEVKELCGKLDFKNLQTLVPEPKMYDFIVGACKAFGDMK